MQSTAAMTIAYQLNMPQMKSSAGTYANTLPMGPQLATPMMSDRSGWRLRSSSC